MVSPGSSLDQVVKCRKQIGQTYSFMELRKGVTLVGKKRNFMTITLRQGQNTRVRLKALKVMDCVQIMFALWGSALGDQLLAYLYSSIKTMS